LSGTLKQTEKTGNKEDSEIDTQHECKTFRHGFSPLKGNKLPGSQFDNLHLPKPCHNSLFFGGFF
jgi:hypothetical protein